MHKLRALFTRHELTRLGGLLAAMLVMALLEVVGIASILPFMSLVARPEAIEDTRWLQWIYETFGFESPRAMLIASGVAVLVLLTLANAFSAFTMWLQYKFAWNTAHNLATRLVRTYLAEPYEFFLHVNTSDLIKRTLAEVNNLVNGVLITTTDLVARSLVALVIFALLLAVDPLLSLVVFGVLGGAYSLVYVSRRSYLAGLGEDRLHANGRRFRTLYEALTGIKTVKTHSAQAYFYERFAQASYRLTRIFPNYQLVAQTPRYAVETLAFGGILTITLYLLATEQNMQAALPILSLYALAGYRLLPALQRIFIAAAQLRHTYPVVDEFYEELRLTSPDAGTLPPMPEPLPFDDRITLEHLDFRYRGGDRSVVHDVNVVIPKGASVAFVGSTGSGKTTLVDLIMGLLPPTEGRILIDGRPLEGEHINRWHRTVGYVPQEVFLYDDTVARNIAFGVPDDEIEPERVREVARVAQAHDFIERELPEGYDTPIGERGVRISGGQRQRLGLARALYHNPQVLLLDEATSALDGITEEALIRAVRGYAADLTMILIAHRLSTVKPCDCIYLLDDGRIVQQGTFTDLLASNPMFRRMAELTS